MKSKVKTWTQAMLELVERTSTDLPADVENALKRRLRSEACKSPARWALETILQNIRLARERRAPLCQDTGMPAFYCRVPDGFKTEALREGIRAALREATRRGVLRENAVDTLTGRALPGNLGPGMPAVHIEPGRRSDADVRLMLKGGGSENVSRQYSLPDAALGAQRDLEGVRRCVLDAVVQAQGNGCPPGILGVCIGGDKAEGAEWAKRQFLRPLDDVSPVPALAALERRLEREINSLEIGPMGLGGRTTALAVKIGVLSRLPACYFVSVSYMCWAMRRRGALFTAEGILKQWIYP